MDSGHEQVWARAASGGKTELAEEVVLAHHLWCQLQNRQRSQCDLFNLEKPSLIKLDRRFIFLLIKIILLYGPKDLLSIPQQLTSAASRHKPNLPICTEASPPHRATTPGSRHKLHLPICTEASPPHPTTQQLPLLVVWFPWTRFVWFKLPLSPMPPPPVATSPRPGPLKSTSFRALLATYFFFQSANIMLKAGVGLYATRLMCFEHYSNCPDGENLDEANSRAAVFLTSIFALPNALSILFTPVLSSLSDRSIRLIQKSLMTLSLSLANPLLPYVPHLPRIHHHHFLPNILLSLPISWSSKNPLCACYRLGRKPILFYSLFWQAIGAIGWLIFVLSSYTIPIEIVWVSL